MTGIQRAQSALKKIKPTEPLPYQLAAKSKRKGVKSEFSLQQQAVREHIAVTLIPSIKTIVDQQVADQVTLEGKLCI